MSNTFIPQGIAIVKEAIDADNLVSRERVHIRPHFAANQRIMALLLDPCYWLIHP
jgi:hypothetical protein